MDELEWKKENSRSVNHWLLITTIIIIIIIVFIQVIINLKIQKNLETLNQNISEAQTSLEKVSDKYEPLIRRKIPSKIESKEAVNEEELASLLNISLEELNQIKNNYLVNDETGYSSEANFALIEKYIMESNEKYTKIIYEELYNKSNDKLYSNWYAHILSGKINYQLGGTITEISLDVNDNSLISGNIVVDTLFRIDVSSNVKGGVSLKTYYMYDKSRVSKDELDKKEKNSRNSSYKS